jgi:L-glutamine---4-(methylsulfanyl)-2-oxobutanoate aminotransferase
VFVTTVESPADGVKRLRNADLPVGRPHGTATYDRLMRERGGEGRPRPRRLDRLPEQYFAALLGRIAAAAADGGPPVVDLGRGNPEVGPPPHVVEALKEAAARPDGHGYAPFRGLPALRAAIANRYRAEYGVEIDPEREVAVVPGGKQALLELALVLGEGGRTILLPDPYYPDYPSGIALAGADLGLVPLDPAMGWQPNLEGLEPAAGLYLNFPSNPCAVCAHPGVFEAAVRYADRTGTVIVHDAAYIDLVFDGRAPESFLATPGAKDAGVELWTMSKTYGMAGWRIAFVLGNAEIVERLNVIGDHSRVGILAALQRAAIAALEGPQASVEERRATYERRRNRLAAALAEPPVCEGSFYVWLRLPPRLTPERLLTEHRVALAPGEGFGPSGAGWARLSLAVSDEVFDEGVERLAPVLEAAYA